MLIVDFIKNNSDWRQILPVSPYCIEIKEKGNYVLFYYGIKADFKNPLVQECRGLILLKDTWEVVSFPFTKFFNVNEHLAAKIDWNSARILEKIDGSLIKVWFHNDWHVSTMSMIDAHDASLSEPNASYKTFFDLFMEGFNKTGKTFDDLNGDYTYCFELVSPFNRVVINYKEIEIYHIFTRNNKTYQELEIDIGIKKPKKFCFNTMEEVFEVLKNMPYSEEGFVIVDKFFNRVKAKSHAYLAVHHLRLNGQINKKRILELILLNQHDEFLSYFPEYELNFVEVKQIFEDFIFKMKKDVETVKNKEFATRKDYALFVKFLTYPPFMFALLDNKECEPENYLRNLSVDKLSEILKL